PTHRTLYNHTSATLSGRSNARYRSTGSCLWFVVTTQTRCVLAKFYRHHCVRPVLLSAYRTAREGRRKEFCRLAERGTRFSVRDGYSSCSIPKMPRTPPATGGWWRLAVITTAASIAHWTNTSYWKE